MGITSETDDKAQIKTDGSPPPNWDHVPFKVRCARCGENLRGLTESRCPTCRLEFDWADAVPVERLTCSQCGYHLYGLSETRCPECGEWFTWDDALADYHSRQKPLFEYRIRDHPLRSLLRTWWSAIRPVRLWRSIDIHDPPQVGALLVMMLSTLFVFLLTITVVHGVRTWLRESWGFLYFSRGSPWAKWLGYLPYAIMESSSDKDAHGFVAALFVWFGMTFLSLMIFRQSMRRCRIRTAQVVRVWAYAVTPSVLAVCVCGTLYSFAKALLAQQNFPHVAIVLTLAAILHVMRSLHVGYRDYLRMPHSWGVAVASVVMAFLGSALFLLVVLHGFTVRMYSEVFQRMGFW